MKAARYAPNTVCLAIAFAMAIDSQAADRPIDPPAVQFSNVVIWVTDVPATARFYSAAFGIKTHVDMNLGTYQWLELDTGSTKLSFASEPQATELFGKAFRPNRLNQDPQAFGLSFRVANAATTYAAALSAGARSIHGPKAEPWGAMIARVRDPNGVVIDIIGPPERAQ